MRYVTHDGNRNLTGSYDQDLQPEHQNNYIEVDEYHQRNWTQFRVSNDHNVLELIPPQVPQTIVPEFVPMLSARLVLIEMNLLSDVNSYIDSISGIEGEKTRAYFDFSPIMHRDNEIVLAFCASKNFTSEQIDALFIQAAEI